MQRKEAKDANEKSPRVAAFFDLDGTLIPLPSLEKRFFHTLRYRREIPVRNCLLWIKEVLRLLPRGFHAVAHANKMYLRGVPSLPRSGGLTPPYAFPNSSCVGGGIHPGPAGTPPYESDAEDGDAFSARKSGRPSMFRASQAEGQAPAPPRRTPRCPVPRFFEDAVQQAAWHARQGHAIAIVSGTLEPLALAAASELEAELAARGAKTEIHACATRLEEMRGKWTGRILGETMFGGAKARAVKALAEEFTLDLGRSYAYGDSANDQPLLASVGNPAAVNPSRGLARIAGKRGWPIFRWKKVSSSTHRHGEEERQALRQAERCS